MKSQLNIRKTVLKASALGIIVYSIAVLVYANTVPSLGVQILGQSVAAVRELPTRGKTPEAGDVVHSVAGVTIESWPRFVNVISHLRSDRFLVRPVTQLAELDAIEENLAEWDGHRYVRLRLHPKDHVDQSYDCWFRVGNLPWQQTAISIVWFVLESVVFWMAWLLYRRRPEDDAAALFFLMCIVTVGAFMGGYHWIQIASYPALVFVFALCAMAVPQVSLHFYLLLPTPKSVLVRHPFATFCVLYLVPAVLQVAILATIGSVVHAFRHGQPIVSGQQLQFLWWLISIYLGCGGALFLGCMGSLLHSYRTVRHPVQRLQVQWILVGAVLASVFVGYSFWLALVRPIEFALGNATWSMFAASVAFIGAYAISITRYHLFDADDLVQRGALYLFISFLGGLCYYGMLVLVVWLAPNLHVTESTHGPFLLATVLMLSLFALSSIRTQLQKVVDRRFYREKHRLDRAIRRMDEMVGQLVERDALQDRFLFRVTDQLDAREAAIYVRNDKDDFPLGHQLGPRQFPDSFGGDHDLVRRLTPGSLLQVHPGPVLPGDESTPLLRRLGVELAQPFVTDDRLIGFLLVGPKEDGMYSSDELDFLSALSDLAGLALQNAQTRLTLEKLNADLREQVNRMSEQQKRVRALQGSRDGGPSLPPPASRAANGSNPSTGPIPARESLNNPEVFEELRGSSAAVLEMIATVQKVSATTSTVLIRGESGTGKGLLAEIIHRNSPRSNGPFVTVHCAALSPGVLESELFGHVKGAFTGAHRDKMGRFQLAHRGTLFLDEIGDVSLDLQTKLLRVLQEMVFEPVGSNETVRTDVRIIAATNQPLEDYIRKGRFREDLFYRLNVISIRTPPLRDRRDDIPELASFFLRKFGANVGKKALEGIDRETMQLLVEYDWPGNIRELENVIERGCVLTDGPTLGPHDLPSEMLGTPQPMSPPLEEVSVLASAAERRLNSELDALEQRRLLEALDSVRGNKSKAARLLGIPRSTLCSKLRKYGIE